MNKVLTHAGIFKNLVWYHLHHFVLIEFIYFVFLLFYSYETITHTHKHLHANSF